jgi:hypothetical protein
MIYDNASISRFASRRSAVPNPSVKRSHTEASRSRAPACCRGAAIVHIADVLEDDGYFRTEPSTRALVDASGMRTVLTVALRKDEVLLGALTNRLPTGGPAVLGPADRTVCGFLPHDRENSLRLSAVALCHTL